MSAGHGCADMPWTRSMNIQSLSTSRQGSEHHLGMPEQARGTQEGLRPVSRENGTPLLCPLSQNTPASICQLCCPSDNDPAGSIGLPAPCLHHFPSFLLCRAPPSCHLPLQRAWVGHAPQGESWALRACAEEAGGLTHPAQGREQRSDFNSLWALLRLTQGHWTLAWDPHGSELPWTQKGASSLTPGL